MKRMAYIRSDEIYNDSRAYKEITALADEGYTVVVFGWNRDGKAVEKSREVFADYGERVRCFFFEAPIAGGIGLRNIGKLFAWARWLKRTYAAQGAFDVVHCCNLDGALGVWKYARRHGARLVYDIYDYYVDSHRIPRVLAGWVEQQEIDVINHADLTVICTEERREQIAKATPRSVAVIHNSPQIDSIPAVEPVYDYVYCGSLFGKRLIGEILDTYPDNCDLTMAFAGYGTFEGAAQALSDKYDTFRYLGSIPYSEVLAVEAQSRAIAAIYEPTIRNHRLCAPNKFYEALALGKPVIVCRGTGIDAIVEQYTLGYVIDYDAAEFYGAVRRIAAEPDAAAAMGARARQLYETQYAWSIMKERLTGAYRALIK